MQYVAVFNPRNVSRASAELYQLSYKHPCSRLNYKQSTLLLNDKITHTPSPSQGSAECKCNLLVLVVVDINSKTLNLLETVHQVPFALL